MKKVSIIGTVGIPARYGGFETFAHNLVKYLSNQYEIIVFCSRKHYKNREKSYLSAKRIFLPLKANGIQSVPYDIISIIIALGYGIVGSYFLRDQFNNLKTLADAVYFTMVTYSTVGYGDIKPMKKGSKTPPGLVFL